MEGLVRLDADGVAQLPDQAVGLLQGDAGYARHGGGLNPAAVRQGDGCHHFIEVEAGALPLPRSALRGR